MPPLLVLPRFHRPRALRSAQPWLCRRPAVRTWPVGFFTRLPVSAVPGTPQPADSREAGVLSFPFRAGAAGLAPRAHPPGGCRTVHRPLCSRWALAGSPRPWSSASRPRPPRPVPVLVQCDRQPPCPLEKAVGEGVFQTLNFGIGREQPCDKSNVKSVGRGNQAAVWSAAV